MKTKLFTTLSLALMSLMSVEAKVTLPSILADDMVVQRNADVKFWGESSAEGKSVKISPSWSKTTYKATVEGGKWSVKIPTTDAGGPYTISFNDGEELTLTNILLGDVWILMGQSNMEMPMSGFGFKEQAIAGNTQRHQGVEGSAEVISKAKESTPIRMYKMAFTPKNAPQESCAEGEWMTNNPNAVFTFSAAGYFFGMNIQEALDIPIGLLSINRGSSAIETWMSREWLSSVGDYDFSILDSEKIPNNPVGQVCYLYNGMLAPLEGLSVKGALWYQGESNRTRIDKYMKQFPAFVAGLREHFDSGEFPFYFAQIAPYSGKIPANDFSVVLMREAQAKLQDITPRTVMISLTDIGEEKIIHPRFKKEVGDRFALVALCDTYGVEGISYRTPQYNSMMVMKDSEVKLPGIAIKFDNAPIGLMFKSRSGGSTQFEIAGEDRVFHPAQAKLINAKGCFLWVWSEDVPNPVAVRYAYKNYAEGDLYNTFGLPVSSFRTDDWEL